MFPHRVKRSLRDLAGRPGVRAFACRRSLLVKTVGYRLLSVVVTAVIAFVLLGDASTAVDVGIRANVAKMGVYYAYEKAWAVAEPRAIGDAST